MNEIVVGEKVRQREEEEEEHAKLEMARVVILIRGVGKADGIVRGRSRVVVRTSMTI